MAKGGIYDQVGGGFARYSVDAHWLVPHFEKMLYDNALLARAYLHAWQLTGDELFRRVCEETLDWALREMRGPEGGFYSALDADSEGEEGKFYVWTEQELREVLGDDADALITLLGRRPRPQLRGPQHPERRRRRHRPGSVLARARQRLYDVRSQRVWPGLDDKRLTAWNALMVAALADAGAVLGRADYLDAARQCAGLPAGEDARPATGACCARTRTAALSLNAYLEDHAFLSRGAAGAVRGDARDALVRRGAAARRRRRAAFPRPEGRGGFFDTASDHE